jgi:hypothetical protein
MIKHVRKALAIASQQGRKWCVRPTRAAATRMEKFNTAAAVASPTTARTSSWYLTKPYVVMPSMIVTNGIQPSSGDVRIVQIQVAQRSVVCLKRVISHRSNGDQVN